MIKQKNRCILTEKVLSYIIIQRDALQLTTYYVISFIHEISYRRYQFGLVDPLFLNLLISRSLLHHIVDALYAIRDEDLRNAVMGLMKLSLTDDPIIHELFREYIFSEKLSDPRNTIVHNPHTVFVEVNPNNKYSIDYRLLHRYNYP